MNCYKINNKVLSEQELYNHILANYTQDNLSSALYSLSTDIKDNIKQQTNITQKSLNTTKANWNKIKKEGAKDLNIDKHFQDAKIEKESLNVKQSDPNKIPIVRTVTQIANAGSNFNIENYETNMSTSTLKSELARRNKMLSDIKIDILKMSTENIKSIYTKKEIPITDQEIESLKDNIDKIDAFLLDATDNNRILTTILKHKYIEKIQILWDKQAKIGTAIHESLSNYLTNEEANINLDNVISIFKESGIERVDDFKQDVQTLLTEIKEKVKDKTILSEFKLVYQIPSEYESNSENKIDHFIIGIADLIAIDNDGNVTVYDFKTKFDYKDSKKIDQEKIKQTYTQLYLYKNMISQLGIQGVKTIKTEVIPININYNAKEDKLTSISYGDINDWTIDTRKTSLDTITSNARTYIPPKIISTQDYSSIETEVNRQFNTIFGDKVETLEKDKEEELSLTKIKVEYTPSKKSWSYYNTVTNKMVYIQKGSENNSNDNEELQQSINEYRVQLKNSKSNTTQNMMEQLGKLVNGEEITERNAQLLKFCIGDYYSSKDIEVIQNESLADLGFIAIKHKNSNLVDLIQVTVGKVDQKLTFKYGSKDNILSNISDLGSQKGNLLQANVANVAAIRALLIANQLMNTSGSELQGLVINNVKVTSKESRQLVVIGRNQLRTSYDQIVSFLKIEKTNKVKFAEDTEALFDTFKSILNEISDSDNGIESKYGSEGLKMSKDFYKELSSIFKTSGGNKPVDIKELMDLFDDPAKLEAKAVFTTTTEKTDRLRDLLTYLQTQYPELKTPVGASADTRQAVLYRYVNEALLRLMGITANLDKVIGGGTMFSWKQKKVFNGLDMVTFDAIDIDIIKQLDVVIRNIETAFSTAYLNYKQKDRIAIKKLYKHKNLTYVATELANPTLIAFSNLYERDSDGKISSEFKLKKETDKSLSKEEAEFIEYYLTDLNTYRFSKFLDPNSESLSKEKIQMLKDKGVWYLLPLKRASSNSKISNALFDSSGISDSFGKIKNSIVTEWDNYHNERGDLTIEEYNERGEMKWEQMHKTIDIYDTMDNIYDEDVLQKRSDLIQTKGIEYFEFQLEVLKDDYIKCKIKKKVYDKVLPIIYGVAVNLQHNAFMSNKSSDVQELITFLEEWTKSNIMDQSLVSASSQGFNRALGTVKAVSSAIILGGNWMSLGKEMAVGLWKANQMALAGAASGMNFGYRDVVQAWKMLSVDVLKQWKNVTLVEQLNETYRLANFDTNEIADNMNRHVGDFGKILYHNYTGVRAGDYWNRMVILLAQMNHDKCLGAHSLDSDNILKYDMKKDQRFTALTKGDKTNPNYQFQKALYLAMHREFREADVLGQYGLVNYDKDDTFPEDPSEIQSLPRAYTTRQESEIKTISDTMYGYMDHTTKSLMFKKAFISLLTQFQTFATAKRNQWLQTPMESGRRGKYDQLQDLEGNLLYWEYNIDENGQPYKIKTTNKLDSTGNENMPVVEWNNYRIEGYLWTIQEALKAVSLLRHKDLAKIWANPHKRANIIMAAHDIFLLALFSWLFGLLFGESKQESLRSDNTWKRLAARLAYNAISDINPVDTMMNFISFDSPSFNLVTQYYNDINDVLFKDKPYMSLVTNYGALRPFKPELTAE